jgi:hypothetical protein
MRTFLLLAGVVIYSAATAQVVVPIQKAPEKISKTLPKRSARTMAEQSLPFWDDFSATISSVPRSELWFAGRTVWVNSGLGINPPSINVATFDGIDSTGRTYSVNEVLAKGFADKLESQPILLADVDPTERNSVFISFFYQIKGRGELPDDSDILTLWFRDDAGVWHQVWSHENDGIESTTEFTQVILQIADAKFFHNGFQFKFQNFARLSGPYDTWHVDYIYLNKGRSSDDLSYPDRTIIGPLTSLFGTYHAVPIKHLRRDPSIITNPSLSLTNLRLDQVPGAVGPQVANYSTEAKIISYTGGVASEQDVTLDVQQGIEALVAREIRTISLATTPDANLIAATADSAFIKLNVQIETKDNIRPTDPEAGDYIEAKYSPIDFRHSDTTSTTFPLVNYYSYDDGQAEYGAGLNQPGAQMAYEFDLQGADTENITNVGFYFPRFGDESSQVVELKIWQALTDNPEDLLHTELISVQRTDNNIFVKRTLSEPVPVGKRFYVGWKQTTTAIIAVGLDKNNDTGNKMFFNVNGTWTANTQIVGSLMIRPFFGEGIDQDTTGLDENSSLSIYPNPSSGSFSIAGRVDQVMVRDITGRIVSCAVESSSNETRVALHFPAPGIYIVSVVRGSQLRSSKLVIR